MAVTRIKNNQITDSTINAAAKLADYSITSGKIANNLTYNSSLTVAGNLTVQGNVTAIDTVDLVVEDPLIVLAKDQTGTPALDIGFIGERGNLLNIAFIWNESTTEFATVFTEDLISNTTITVNSYANLHTLNLDVDGNIDLGGNIAITGNITGDVDITGNLTAGNLAAVSAVSAGTTVTATGNVTGGNINTAGQVVATGNVSGGNLVTAGDVTTATVTASSTVTATGNVSGGNITTAGQVAATGNVTGGNINTAGQVVATGNVSGGNLVTAGDVTTATVTASSTVTATGNVTGGNITTTGQVVATGNVNGGNLVTANDVTTATVTASGNITGGNITTAGRAAVGTLETTGNALIGGNLVVQGNITYINIDDLRVEDPIIILGTGPNGTPLTTDDGKDRGIYMEYYTTGLGNAFVGWQNSSGNMIMANDVEFSGNDVVQINSYGNLNVGNLFPQSINLQSGNLTAGNVISTGIVSATGNVTGGNITTAGDVTTATVTASGNITGGNLDVTSGITAGTTIVSTGNITGGNINTTGQVVATGNIDGGNLVTGGVVDATGNVSGGNITTAGVVDATGNVTGGNITTAGDVTTSTVTASGNISAGNIAVTGIADLGNIQIEGDDITNKEGNDITFNAAGADINIVAAGTNNANLFVVDAGSDTVLIGTGTATTNAALKIGTTNSILVPVGTTLERPDTPVTGMVRFNTSLDNLEFYDSDSWSVAGSQFTVIVANTQTGNGIQTAFTLPESGTTAGTIVAINGVVQIPVTAYSVTGNVCTFTEAPESTDVIDFRQLTTTAEVTAIATAVGSAVEVDQVNIEIDITGNMIPTSNVTYSLGNATNQWNDLYLAGNTIFLGPLRLEAADDSTFVVYKSDGTTQANIDVGNVDVSAINSGTSIIGISEPNGNAYVTVGGTANVLVVGTTTSSFSSALTATGNITGGNIITGGLGSFTGNVTGGNLRTAAVTIGATGAVSGVTTISASGNITGGNLDLTSGITAGTTIVSTGNITGGNIITAGLVSLSSITKTGSNGVGNIGSSTSYFNTVFAKATSAQYADLAEMYEADADYEPGTVLSFGGDHEVTLCDAVADTRVAGVVSTNPSYLMNSALEAEHVAAVALQGRVPCKVIGPVQKGDLMTSAGNGQAKADNTAGAGTIIGKALEDFNGSSGVIEVVVGRS